MKIVVANTVANERPRPACFVPREMQQFRRFADCLDEIRAKPRISNGDMGYKACKLSEKL